MSWHIILEQLSCAMADRQNIDLKSTLHEMNFIINIASLFQASGSIFLFLLILFYKFYYYLIHLKFSFHIECISNIYNMYISIAFLRCLYH